ncbi:MAG: FkbM family methyltransferase [Actinomycetota bacterium]|nr:FkbM family methyltransferase [Actinomycetota bacterium]
MKYISINKRCSKSKCGTETITVKTRTLDSVLEEEGIEKVDFIKIDVEGADLGVLREQLKILRS